MPGRTGRCISFTPFSFHLTPFIHSQSLTSPFPLSLLTLDYRHPRILTNSTVILFVAVDHDETYGIEPRLSTVMVENPRRESISGLRYG